MAAPDLSPVLASIPFVYRDLNRGGAAPATDEIHVAPTLEGDHCLARLVLEQGPDAMPHGAEPGKWIVIKADPTLDDMLAATLVGNRLDGRPMPAGVRPFVEYAAVLRQGLTPGTAVPLERSLVGLYKAIRWRHLDLTDLAQGRRFTEEWNRLAAVIFAYAADGLDPFAEFPLPSWLFADDQLFLKGDRNLYQRDKLAGEVWQVTIPDEGPAARPRSGLLLRRPQSRLWKEWARSDAAASRKGWRSSGAEKEPTAAGYDLLAVDEDGTGNWVFSTNPVQRLAIRSLRDRLQMEELVRAPHHAVNDPWVSLFDDTLVAAPGVGTAIPEIDLVRLVKHWGHVRTVRPRRRLIGSAALVALSGLVLVGLLGAGRAVPAAAAPIPPTSLVEQGADMSSSIRALPERASGVSKAVDQNLRPGLEFQHDFFVDPIAPQPVKFSVTIALLDGDLPAEQTVGLTVNSRDVGDVRLIRDGSSHAHSEARAAFLHAGQNVIGVRFVNGGAAELRAIVNVVWDKCPEYKPDLYLLAIGMGHYHGGAELQFAESDASALAKALRNQKGVGKPFQEVHVLPGSDGLLDPTKENLVRELQRLADVVNKAPEGAIAWIVVTGHGRVERDGRFHLLIPSGSADRNDDTLSSDEFYARINLIRGPVVVLLDTCESSQSFSETATLTRVVLSKEAADWGRVVISAGAGRTHEADEWKHSALCLAALECVTGQYQIPGRRYPDHLAYCLQSGRPFVTLDGFCQYVKSRVKQLYEERRDKKSESAPAWGAGRDHRVGILQNPTFDLDRIAIAGGAASAH